MNKNIKNEDISKLHKQDKEVLLTQGTFAIETTSQAVKEKLEMRAESMDMQDYIYRVVIPEEKIVEVKRILLNFVIF